MTCVGFLHMRVFPLIAVTVTLALGWPSAAWAAPRPASPRAYDAAAQAARRLLDALVRADTSNPPGNEARAARIGAERLKAAGIPHEVLEFAPGRESLVARLKGRGTRKPVLLLAHTDVVGAQGQTWSFPPHDLTEDEGYLYGRGVSDDLGMAAVALEVMVFLKESGVVLDRDVILAWTGDEESGGLGLQRLLETRPEAVECGVAFNEGGGIVLGDDGSPKLVNLQVAEKTYHDFELTAQGRTGHSSVPMDDNAIYQLSEALARLGRRREPARLHPAVRAYLRERATVEAAELGRAMREVADSTGSLPAAALSRLEEDPSLAALLRTTCVATQVSGGTRANALPAEARATVNCRILPDETPEQVRDRLRLAIADEAVEVRTLEAAGSGPSSALEGEGPDAVRSAMRDLFPGIPIIPVLSRGATDSRFLRQRGVPVYGFNPIPKTEADDRRAHGVDERIPAGGLRTAVEVLHRLLLALD